MYASSRLGIADELRWVLMRALTARLRGRWATAEAWMSVGGVGDRALGSTQAIVANEASLLSMLAETKLVTRWDRAGMVRLWWRH